MDRKTILKSLSDIKDPKKDYSKILGNLHYTHFALLDKYKKLLKPYGLSFPQSNVLAIVVHFHPQALSLEEIKALVLEPNSDVSRTVVRLEDKGFVRKVVNPDNRRKRTVMVTDAGLTTYRKLKTDKKFESIMENVTLQNAIALSKVLEILRKNSHL